MSSKSNKKKAFEMQNHISSLKLHNIIMKVSLDKRFTLSDADADSEGPVIRSSYSTRNLAKFRNGTRKRKALTTALSATTSDWNLSWAKGHATCSTTMPTQKLTKLPIFAENFSTNLLKLFLLLTQITFQSLIKERKAHVVSLKTALLRATQIIKKESLI